MPRDVADLEAIVYYCDSPFTRRRMDSFLYRLRQTHEEVDNTQELLAISMDSHRNSILQLNMRCRPTPTTSTDTHEPRRSHGSHVRTIAR